MHHQDGTTATTKLDSNTGSTEFLKRVNLEESSSAACLEFRMRQKEGTMTMR